MTRMPFGKHRGRDLGQVPAAYLTWVLDTVDIARYPGLRRAIKTRLALADYEESPGRHAATPSMGSTAALAAQMAT